ncbi:ESPR-type extended signal peptide-containing protein [Arthrobacter sp. NPDC080086]|uniref:YadA family autotransporter adhesin n=1 Tax=Arthrobacter sp. NPDC080086 TaxID=3155917 RepID=UPI00344F1342
MNKAYRVVFNKATGVWAAVSEIARGRGKGRTAVKAVGSALIAGAASLSAPGAIAQVLIEQPDADGPISFGRNATGAVVDFTNQGNNTRRLTGIENGVASSDAVTVNQLNSTLNYLGARISTVNGAVIPPSYTLGPDSTGGTTYSTVPGALGNLDDRIKTNTTKVNNLDNIAVKYDTDATTGDKLNSVTLDSGTSTTGVAIHNVANGDVAKDSKDAVNGGQLFDVKSTAEQAAKAAANSVQYDTDPTTGDKLNSVTLDSGTSTTGVAIHNVANGDVVKDSKDAVNGGQLFDVKSTAEQAAKAAANSVQYDTDPTTGDKLNSVTLDSGTSTTGVAIHNVANGDVAKDSKDAVNGGQLFDVKSTAEQAAKAAANSVQYDAAGDTITLKNPTGGTGPVQIKNVKAGTDDTDAVNFKQLKDAGLVGNDGKLANAVTYDSDKKDSVTLGGLKDDGTGTMVPATAPVKLSNIANGVNANDAVNFSQLNGVGSALGGGASFNNGVWTGPTYSFQNGDKYHDVGGALDNLDKRVFSLEGGSTGGGQDNPRFVGSGGGEIRGPKEEAQATGNYATAAGANAVASAANSVALGANSVADRENTVSVGSVGNERIITNVKAGVNDTDAVNYGQFKDVKAQADATQQAVGNLQSQVNQIDGKVNRVGAMNAAMSTMVASAAGLQTDNRMAIGTGLYRGETALAIGYQRKIGSRATVTIGGSTAGGKEYNVGVGAGFGW